MSKLKLVSKLGTVALLGSALILPSTPPEKASASENTTKPVTTEPVNELNGNLYQYEQLVTTYGWPWTAITKTITKNYNSADVPAAVYYTEYIDGKWYSGTLERTGEIVKLGPTIWQATYTGKINY